MTQPGIEPQSTRPLANTLLIRPIARSNTNNLYIMMWFLETIQFNLRLKILVIQQGRNAEHNSYYRKWTWQPEFKFWTRLFVFYFMLTPLGKNMNLSAL